MSSTPKHKPVDVQNNAGRRTSGDGQTEDRILDVDALSGFTIPKKKKAQGQLLESLQNKSLHERDLLDIIQKSYKDAKNLQNYTYSQFYLINNDSLLTEFLEKKKEMKSRHLSDKEMADSYVFTFKSHYAGAKHFCEHGVKVKSSKSTFLGNPNMGVYLSRHADILSPEPFRPGYQGKLVVFKIMKGKVKSMLETRDGVGLDPSPNFDCHVPKSSAQSTQGMTSQEAFESSQIYVYEYNDMLEPAERPRQVLPYAMVTFQYSGHYQCFKANSRPSKTNQTSHHRPSHLNSAGSIKPDVRSSQQAFKGPPSSPSVYPPNHGPGLLPTPPSPAILNSGPGLLPAPPPPPPFLESPVCHQHAMASRAGALPSPAVHNSTHMGVGSKVGEGGVVCWTGSLSLHTVRCAESYMVTFNSNPVSPALIGQKLNLSKGLKWQHMDAFRNYPEVNLRTEMRWDRWFVTYCKLFSQKGCESLVQSIIDQLMQETLACHALLDEGVRVLIMPDCDITVEKGLKPSSDLTEPCLHCFFFLPRPRVEMQQARALWFNMKLEGGSKEWSKKLFYPPKPKILETPDKPEVAEETINSEELCELFEKQAVNQDQRTIDIARGLFKVSKNPSGGSRTAGAPPRGPPSSYVKRDPRMSRHVSADSSFRVSDTGDKSELPGTAKTGLPGQNPNSKSRPLPPALLNMIDRSSSLPEGSAESQQPAKLTPGISAVPSVSGKLSKKGILHPSLPLPSDPMPQDRQSSTSEKRRYSKVADEDSDSDLDQELSDDVMLAIIKKPITHPKV